MAALLISLTSEQRAHSATRFVLPFELLSISDEAKWGHGVSAGKEKPYYELAQETDWEQVNRDGRGKYLTGETAYVLFERASWWVMRCVQQEFSVPLARDRTRTAILRPPWIVLFEDKSRHRLLRCGLLVVEVAFCGGADKAWELGDLLLFNELFRYWREPYTRPKRHYDEVRDLLECFMKPVALMTGQQVTDPYEDRWMALLRVPLKDGSLLVDQKAADVNAVLGGYADDRAFVWTRALVERAGLEQIIPHRQDGKGDWEALTDPETGGREMFGDWIRLLNVDKPSAQEATAFEKKWIAERTYGRWEQENCYYGFNNFSGAMMSGLRTDPPTWQHWFEMYFDQILLLLYVRVTLFRFSRALTDISGRMLDNISSAKSNVRVDDWLGNFRKFRRAFTCFENLYQFPLLSNQQQAIEMYTKARKWMDIDDLYNEVSREIQSSDELLEAEVENKRSEYAYVLNILAAIGLGLSVALSCYQIEGFKHWWEQLVTKVLPFLATSSPVWWSLLWVALFYFGAKFLLKREERKQHRDLPRMNRSFKKKYETLAPYRRR